MVTQLVLTVFSRQQSKLRLSLQRHIWHLIAILILCMQACIGSDACAQTAEDGIRRIEGRWVSDTNGETLEIRKGPFNWEANMSDIGRGTIAPTVEKGSNIEITSRSFSCYYLVSLSLHDGLSNINMHLIDGPNQCLKGVFSKEESTGLDNKNIGGSRDDDVVSFVKSRFGYSVGEKFGSGKSTASAINDPVFMSFSNKKTIKGSFLKYRVSLDNVPSKVIIDIYTDTNFIIDIIDISFDEEVYPDVEYQSSIPSKFHVKANIDSRDSGYEDVGFTYVEKMCKDNSIIFRKDPSVNRVEYPWDQHNHFRRITDYSELMNGQVHFMCASKLDLRKILEKGSSVFDSVIADAEMIIWQEQSK